MPHYNFLYLPLAHFFHRATGALFGWDGYRSIEAFSAVCVALSVAVVTRGLGRYRIGDAARVGLGLVFAVTPSVWFFATVGEVHGLQLLSVAIGTELALRARDARSNIAVAWTAGAVALVLMTHLSTVLIVPGLVLLARGKEPNRGLALWGRESAWTWIGALGLAGIGVVAAFSLGGGGGRLSVPAQMFGLFVSEFWGRISEGILFTPAEMAGFLAAEFVIPAAGWLPLAVAAGFVVRKRRLGLPVLVAVVPYLLVLPQGGVRELGAYYLSLLPLLVHFVAAAIEEMKERGQGARIIVPAIGATLALHVGVGAVRQADQAHRRDAREWATEAFALCSTTDSVFVVSSLPRQHAILLDREKRIGADDYRRRFELVPASFLDQEIRVRLSTLGGDIAHGNRVLIDSEILVGDERPAVFLRFEELLRDLPLELVPLPAGDETPLLFEILWHG